MMVPRAIVTLLLIVSILVAPLTGATVGSPPPSPELSPSSAPGLTANDPTTVSARAIVAGGPGLRSAILAALNEAGMPVRNPDGSYLEWPSGANQHVGFAAWEIDAMVRASSNGSSAVPLESLASAIKGMAPMLASADVATFLVNGIRADSKSGDPALRSWANIIIALGREGFAHYDLMSDTDTARVSFDAIQSALILRRLAGDWHRLARSKRVASRNPAIIVAEAGQGDFGPTQAIAAGSPACSADEQTAEMMELGAAIQDNAFDQFIEWLQEVEHAEKGAEAASNLTGAVNVAITYAELLLTYLAMLDFKMDIKNPPLVRNKTRPPGEQRELVATARLNAKNWTWKNCLRNALANLGLDTGSIFVDGPVKDGAVDWTLTEGNAIVEFSGQKASRVPTDENGESKIIVQGKARPEDLPDGVVDVTKHATAAGLLQLQRANMRGDFIAALGTSRSIFGILKVPAELIKRTTLLTRAASVGFTVIDYKFDLIFRVKTEVTNDAVTCCPGYVARTDQFHLEAVVPLTYEPIDPVQNRGHAILGQAPPNFYSAKNLSQTGFKCPYSISGIMPGNVVAIADPADLKFSNGVFHVRLFMALPQSQDTVITCGPETLAAFSAFFELLHRKELNFQPEEGNMMSVFDLGDWVPGSGNVIAQKDVQRSNVDCGSRGHYKCTLSEITTFTLERPPQSAPQPQPHST